MFREILHADLCVAVLTGYNAKVSYELAVAQAASRPTILLIEKGQKLPFDVKNLRAIEYSLQPISDLVRKKTYAKLMKQQIESIRDNGWMAKGLFEEFDFPELRDEQQLRHMIQSAAPTPWSTEWIGTTPWLPARSRRSSSSPATSKSCRVSRSTSSSASRTLFCSWPVTSMRRSPARSRGRCVTWTLKKSDSGTIVEDSLNQNLNQQIQRTKLSLPARPGTVIATPTTQLKQDLGVQYIFHVAAMQGSVGDGYRTMDDVLDDCVCNTFNRFAKLAEQRPKAKLETILFPMLGAATTSLEPIDVARQLLKQIVRKMEANPSCRTTYLVAWLESHRYAVQKVAKELGLEEIDQPRLALAS